MKILIVFSSTEGQTRKIMHFAFGKLIEAGHSVALLPAAEAGEVDLSAFDAAILAASVHVGRYQAEMVEFDKGHAAGLSALKTLFVSVSLVAAGDDAKDWEELREIVELFAGETGWTPGEVAHVAGAFKFSDYDFFKYWAMRWIESKKDLQGGEPGTDREYTDWEALDDLLRNWAGG